MCSFGLCATLVSRTRSYNGPAHLAKTLAFNAVIAVDLFYMTVFGSEKIFLVCVGHGTGYVQVARCKDAKAATVRQELCRAWVQPFGVPELILCDQGPEFTGEQCQEHLSQLGAAIHYTDGASPWQNGKAERTVQTLKNKILVTIKDIAAHEEELDVVIAHVVSAYNSMFDRHGFTPDQRVFGRSVRMPASLLADDRLNQELIKEAAGDSVRRTWDIREAARSSWLKKDDAEAVQRARRVQTRRTDHHSYRLQPGQWVYVWRKTDNRHGWTGPGSLIAQVPGSTSWWINVRGRLWKASAEQIRPTSSEEDLGATLMMELRGDLVKQVTGLFQTEELATPPANQPGSTSAADADGTESLGETTTAGNEGPRTGPYFQESETVNPSTYLNVMDSDAAHVPKVHFQVGATEACFSERDRCTYVGKAKTSFGQVEFSKLTGSAKEMFRKSRAKEFKSLLDNRAVKVLSVQESDFADYTLKRSSSRDLWTGSNRRDPQIHQIERSAPTGIFEHQRGRWDAHLRDVKTASLQSRPTDRKTPLACSQPKDEGLPGLDPRQLLLLLTEVYGLVSGPAWCRSSFLQKVQKHGFRLCPYEPCILTLPGEAPGSPTEGVIVIEVDDLIEAGGSSHRKKFEALEKEITFGKVVRLLDAKEADSTYAGRTLRQLPDYSFELNIEEYVYTRLAPVTLTRKVFKKDASEVPLEPSEVTQLRGVVAGLSWVSRECRPDTAAAASILASSFPEPTMQHAILANEVIKQLKQCPMRLRIHSIEETKVRNLVISDSAFDTTGKEKCQHAFFIGFTTDELNLGKPAVVSLTRWCSRRLRRKASSSMLCEAISFSSATAALEKQDALWDALRISYYDPRQRQRVEEETLELQGKSTVIASDAPLYQDPRSLVIIDAKSLFDSLLSGQPCECERTNLEVAVIQESLQVCKARPRHNPADALTKFPGAHLEPLVKLLKSHRFQISDEEAILKQGRQGQQRLKQGLSSLGNLSFLGAVKQYLLSWN
ncbi:unnamed protein product [Symbiodinium sp. CCMP2592]|nr:unnamed protein product [Symbiodinium sp. CCMP2592]